MKTKQNNWSIVGSKYCFKLLMAFKTRVSVRVDTIWPQLMDKKDLRHNSSVFESFGKVFGHLVRFSDISAKEVIPDSSST